MVRVIVTGKFMHIQTDLFVILIPTSGNESKLFLYNSAYLYWSFCTTDVCLFYTDILWQLFYHYVIIELHHGIYISGSYRAICFALP